MPRNNHLYELRNRKLLLRLEYYCNIKEDGVTKHSYEWILLQLSREFYLSTKRIENIIKHTKTKIKI